MSMGLDIGNTYLGLPTFRSKGGFLFENICLYVQLTLFFGGVLYPFGLARRGGTVKGIRQRVTTVFARVLCRQIARRLT